jgi:hypothetical protein
MSRASRSRWLLQILGLTLWQTYLTMSHKKQHKKNNTKQQKKKLLNLHLPKEIFLLQEAKSGQSSTWHV